MLMMNSTGKTASAEAECVIYPYGSFCEEKNVIFVLGGTEIAISVIDSEVEYKNCRSLTVSEKGVWYVQYKSCGKACFVTVDTVAGNKLTYLVDIETKEVKSILVNEYYKISGGSVEGNMPRNSSE